MKQLLLALLCFIILPLSGFCQPAEYFYGSTGEDVIYRIIPSNDGNFLATGAITVNQKKRVWLLKLSPLGDTIWQKTYTPTVAGIDAVGLGVTLLSDGSIIITGKQESNELFIEDTAIAIKTDANGNQIWKKAYSSVTVNSDAASYGNNLLLTGWLKTPGSGGTGTLLLVNEAGMLQWRKEIQVHYRCRVRRIFKTADGNFIIVGRSSAYGAGFEGVFIQKINPNGDLIWQATKDSRWKEGLFKEPENQPLGVVQKNDGSIWMVQPAETAVDGFYLYHYDAGGQLLEEKIYNNDGHEMTPYSLKELPNGDWLITGETSFDSSSEKIGGFACQISANGLEIWRSYYKNPNSSQYLFDAVSNEVEHLLMVGVSENTPDNTSKDGWVLRTEQNGNHLPFAIKGKAVYDLNNNCIADAGEPPAVGWFVNAQDTAAHLLLTDAQGRFLLNTAAQESTLTLKIPEQNAVWTVCQQTQTVTNTPANPTVFPLFLIQASDGGCPKIEISLAQPDLQRCSTSNFVITVRNHGLETSEPLLLDLKMDPELSFVSASENFVSQGATRQCLLPAIERLGVYNIDVNVQLACNVQLGATHTVVAQLHPPSCAPLPTGPFYTVEGQCTGDFVQFMLQNVGTGGVSAQTSYRVLADDLLAAGWQDVILAEGAAPYLLEFPSDGRTWRVEVQQSPENNNESMPSSVVEGCGFGDNGLHSVTLKNSFRFDENSPLIGAFEAANTTGAPNRIDEAPQGFGFYHMIGDSDWLEYTARYEIPPNTTVNEVVFTLRFSPTFDLSTFQPVAGSGHISHTLDKNNTFKISLTGLDLQPGEYALVRFRIKPGNPVDGGGIDGLLSAEGKAFLDGVGPYPIAIGFHNYFTGFPLTDDYYNEYPTEVLRFGGRGFDFGKSLAKGPDGSIFFGIQSSSFGYRGYSDALVIKTTPTGQAIWSNAFDLGDHASNTINAVAALPDGGCIFTGNHTPNNSDGYLSSNSAYFARVDANGQLLWHQTIHPAGDSMAAKVAGITPTLDGNFVLYGYSESPSEERAIDAFFVKIDQQGNIIWNGYQDIYEHAFIPEWIASDNDGDLILLGTNISPSVNFDVYLMKIKLSTGAILWEHGISSQDGIELSGLAVAEDESILVSGIAQWELAPNDYVITPNFIRFTNKGIYIEEKRPLFGPFNLSFCNGIINAPDGGYYALGDVLVDTTDNLNDALLLKIDANADVQWWKSYGARNHEIAQTAIISGPNQLLLGGFNQPRPPLYDLQAFLIRTDLEGNLVVDAPQAPALTPRIGVFPNPAVDRVWVRCEHLSDSLPWLLTDATGRIAQKGTFTNTLSALSLSHLPPGMYYLTFPDGRYRSEKIIVGK